MRSPLPVLKSAVCWLAVLTSVALVLWCSQDAQFNLSNILSLSVIHCLAAYSISP